mmetsp:Transcript_7899/g.9056  ORF Transcript_7899/g.9056 Transcript_7899/m.9056 type:complete len:201 (+) Transcript_7899:144-746(+)|eukprot:CAMPEP_0184009294 /NCGR_PEP_ID=MMETSP0954-20121128/2502_1 /TAXON_ID=627963 /ORGANISM="Aplanochytrium sp, Strain PBS07" /LENGTH=200 /DNA_ID=CAMNT_0026288605 /DNA_START=240 /DNA_END=842 /DNA_ORIENTATION=-
MDTGRIWPNSASQELELSWIFALSVLSVVLLIAIFAYNWFCTKYNSEKPTWFQKGLTGFVRSSAESAEFDGIPDIVFEDNNLQENKSERKKPVDLSEYSGFSLHYGIGETVGLATLNSSTRLVEPSEKTHLLSRDYNVVVKTPSFESYSNGRDRVCFRRVDSKGQGASENKLIATSGEKLASRRGSMQSLGTAVSNMSLD